MLKKRFIKPIATYALITALALSACGKSGERNTGDTGTDNTTESGGNNTGNEEKIPYTSGVLTFSAASGVYKNEFKLEITSDDKDYKEIWYTTDGSDPASSDTAVKYEEAVQIRDRKDDPNVVSAVSPDLFCANYSNAKKAEKTFECYIQPPADEDVDKCMTVRAVAKNAEGEISEEANAVYFIGTMEEHIQGLAESCKASGQPLAVISLSMDYDDLFASDKGIYVKGDVFAKSVEGYYRTANKADPEDSRKLPANYNQKGRDWERLAGITMLEIGGDGSVSTAFSQNCGVRIQGNYSRSDLQKGFRLYARKDYGQKNFEYPVFGEERPCILYLNGEYWGLYILQEDYSDDYFEELHGVDKDNVVLYKGDAEALKLGYKLDEGELPEGEPEDYYFRELLDFFDTHSDLKDQESYDEFVRLVDPQSVLEYFAVETWIDNKWDWPGKNWSMWKSTEPDGTDGYGDGRWRFVFYDLDFGGWSGRSDAGHNTIKEDNYKPKGLLDMDTSNPAVLCFAYLMTNDGFRKEFEEKLLSLSENEFEQKVAVETLDKFMSIYSPLYPQFFDRYKDPAIPNDPSWSIKSIEDFLGARKDNIQKMIDFIEKIYN
ncbi:MAG: CotH kinase family protein [Eubacterium sp.]|nr:CotH kinase family protein [Eubacterium sp.]